MDFNEYQVNEAPERNIAVITRIDSGLVRDFINPDSHLTWGDVDAPAAQITFTKGSKSFTKIFTLPYPPSIELPPRSRLAQFKQYYGRFPEVGMEVELTVNARGWHDVKL